MVPRLHTNIQYPFKNNQINKKVIDATKRKAEGIQFYPKWKQIKDK